MAGPITREEAEVVLRSLVERHDQNMMAMVKLVEAKLHIASFLQSHSVFLEWF